MLPERRSASGPSQPDRVPASPVTVVESVALAACGRRTPVRHGDTTGRLRGWSQPGHGVNPSVFGRADDVGVNGTRPRPVVLPRRRPVHAARRIDACCQTPAGDMGAPVSRSRMELPGYQVARANTLTAGASLSCAVTRSRHAHPSVGLAADVSGEPIRFCEVVIGRADPDELDRAVRTRPWPSMRVAPAQEHRLRVALERVRLVHDVSPEHTTAILAVVMEVTGRMSRTMQADRGGAAPRPTEGASDSEVLGQDVVSGRWSKRGMLQDESWPAAGAHDRGRGAGPRPSIYQRGGSLIRPVKLPHVGQSAAESQRAGTTVLLAVRSRG